MPIQVPSLIPIHEHLSLKSLTLENYLPLWLLIDSNRSYLEKWIPWTETIQSPNDARHFIGGALFLEKQRREINWGIFEDDFLIGLIGLHHLNWDHFSATLGYWIAEEYQSQGILTQTICTLLPIAKENLHLKTIEIHTSSQNKASAKVAEKCLFTCRETLPSYQKIQDTWHDIQIFSYDLTNLIKNRPSD